MQFLVHISLDEFILHSSVCFPAKLSCSFLFDLIFCAPRLLHCIFVSVAWLSGICHRFFCCICILEYKIRGASGGRAVIFIFAFYLIICCHWQILKFQILINVSGKHSNIIALWIGNVFLLPFSCSFKYIRILIKIIFN